MPGLRTGTSRFALGLAADEGVSLAYSFLDALEAVHGSKTDVDEGIYAVYATWFAAMEAADVDRGLSVVSANVIHQSPDGTRRVGREQLRAALAAFHEAYAERVSWNVESVSLSGQEAEVRLRETATVRPRDGAASFRVTGYHVARLRREAAGSWQIVEDRSRVEGAPVTVPHEFELDGS